MYEILNPLRGTVFANSWYLRRKAPKGRVVHLIHPVTLNALCRTAHCSWQWVEEDSRASVCTKCTSVANS